MVNIQDDTQGITIDVLSQYEDFTLYEGYPPTDPALNVTANIISFNALSRASTIAWLRKPLNAGDFHLRLRLNLTSIDSAPPTELGSWLNFASFTRMPTSTTHATMKYGVNSDGITLYVYEYTNDVGNIQFAIYIRDNSQPSVQGVSADGYMFYDSSTGGPYPLPATFWLDIQRTATGGDYIVDIYEDEFVTPCVYYSGPSRLHIIPAVPQTTPFFYFLPITTQGIYTDKYISGSVKDYEFI